MTKPTAKQQPSAKKNFSLKTDDQQRKHNARVAIMTRRLELGIVYEGFTQAYPVTAVGTPDEVQALRDKWGIG